MKAMEIRFNYEEYELLPDDGKRYQVVEGDLYVSPSPRLRHQIVLYRLLLALGAWVLCSGPCPVDPASAGAGAGGSDGRAQTPRFGASDAQGAATLPHDAVLVLLRRANEAAGGCDARRRATTGGSPADAARPRWIPPASGSLSAQAPADYRHGLRIEAGEVYAQQTLVGAAASSMLGFGQPPTAAEAARIGAAVERTFGQAVVGAVRAAYAEVRPGVDALVESAPGRAEEYLVVRRPEALGGLAWRIDLPSAIRTVRTIAGFWEFDRHWLQAFSAAAV